MSRARELGNYGGKILQIVRGSLSTKFAQTTASLVDVGLSASITPSNTTNKILIHTTIWAGGEIDAYPYFCLLRGTTKLTDFEGSASSGNQINTFSSGLFGSLTPMQHRQHCLNRHVLDTPGSASSVTYKIQGANPYTAGGTGNVFVNRASNDGDASYVQNPQSEIVLMEVSV
tara:strand:- start:1438 stop:1956 length:519 start_codon:yes stop_codon:yes gene_type:complete